MWLHHPGLVLCSLRSESISAKLFAAGHHYGKGVKAGAVCPTQPLIPLACRPQPGLPTHQTQYLLRWRPWINCLKHYLGAKCFESFIRRWKRANPVFHLYLCIEKDPAWRLDLNPGNWFRFINHAFCIAQRPVWGLILPMMQPPTSKCCCCSILLKISKIKFILLLNS